ncbi:hypothetical protein ACHAWO_003591 [Cyclotella atomus]|uniref:Transcription elongation factor 1 homolog n=1 Tax=Cyclotella atomus TaxID=382360 RepID=A0ABD3QV11_9STRA
MAKGKKQAAPTKKKPTLAKRFKCPFCANDDVVEAKMDLKSGTGSLSCRICSASYQMPIHHLHEPIDVFSEWLDDCEAAERGEVAAARPGDNKRQNMKNVVHDTSKDYDDDEDDDIPDNPMEMKKAEGPGTVGNASLGLDDSDDDSE